MPKTLLIVANRPSPNTAALADAALAACQNYDGSDIETRCLTPFEVTAPHLLKADAVVIGTTENIGYMAGSTKDMFDRCYNDWMDRTEAKPVAIYIRAGLDGTATKRALTSMCSGLRWRLVAEPLILKGDWDDRFIFLVLTADRVLSEKDTSVIIHRIHSNCCSECRSLR